MGDEKRITLEVDPSTEVSVEVLNDDDNPYLVTTRSFRGNVTDCIWVPLSQDLVEILCQLMIEAVA